MPEESVKAAYDQRAGPNSLINTMMEHPFRVQKETPPPYTHTSCILTSSVLGRKSIRTLGCCTFDDTMMIRIHLVVVLCFLISSQLNRFDGVQLSSCSPSNSLPFTNPLLSFVLLNDGVHSLPWKVIHFPIMRAYER